MTGPPRVTVVVPSHGRAVRLRWCLEALAEQTVPARVLVVSDDDPAPEIGPAHAAELLRLPAGAGTAPAARNAGWRAATTPYVAFTDDDCRPAPDWLERLLAHAAPDAVVQGRTVPDPDEEHLLQRAPHARTMRVDPPTPWGQTCNVLYPRALLERLDGFDERFAHAGEDVDLLQRALHAGARHHAAPEAVVRHAVEVQSLRRRLGGLRRWRAVPAVVARHPQLRAGMPLRLFWKTRHATFALALLGLAIRRPLLALPWLREAWPRYGTSPRGVARSLAELPGQAAVDAAELAIVARGAVDARSPLL